MIATIHGWLAMAPPPAEGAGGGSMLQAMMPMIIIGLIFYFMLLRPQQRKEKERKAMIAAIKTGDRILFAGGILGTVANVKDHTLLVKVADNVKLEVARGAVSRVLKEDEKSDDLTVV